MTSLHRKGRGFLFILPALALFALFTLMPLVYVIRLSFFESNILVEKFVGINNYARILQSDEIGKVLVNSFCYTLVLATGWTAIPLFIALLASGLSKVMQAYTRFVFYIPTFAAGAIIAIVWLYIFHPYGFANWLVGLLGIESQLWLGKRFLAIGSICIVLLMTTLGFYTVIYMSAILSIDTNLYDAAKMDGASRWQMKTKITLPLISPTVAFVALLSLIASLQVWETIFVMSPAVSSYNLMYGLFSTAFESGRYGLGAAKTIVLICLVFSISWMKRRVERG